MKIAESGIILFSEHYEAAVTFYGDSLGLPVRERQADLTVFAFGASYLMVERGGFASPTEKSRQANPLVLRLDIADFESEVTRLKQKNLAVTVDTFAWGRIACLIDTEGNRIELKDTKEKPA